MTWGRDIEELYGGWTYSGGNVVPNDTYKPASSTIYSFYSPYLSTHILNQFSLIFRKAIPIYKFE